MTTTTTPLYEAVPTMAPGSPEWLSVMSASKVPAILGLSHFESRYALWHRMNGTLPRQAEKAEMNRGHYVEPAIAAWFGDQHSHLTVTPAATYRRTDRPWQVVTPDRWLNVDGAQHTILECKSDGARDWEWGPEGSDIIPLAHRCQVTWGMDVLGLDHCYVAVLLPYLDFRWYRVAYDPEDAALLRREAAAFMESLANGEGPDRDDSDHTYEAVRQMSPGVTDRTVDITEGTYTAYVDALIADVAAKRAVNKAKGDLLVEMDGAKVAKYAGRTIATLQTRNGDNPYPVQARGLIEKETLS